MSDTHLNLETNSCNLLKEIPFFRKLHVLQDYSLKTRNVYRKYLMALLLFIHTAFEVRCFLKVAYKLTLECKQFLFYLYVNELQKSHFTKVNGGKW